MTEATLEPGWHSKGTSGSDGYFPSIGIARGIQLNGFAGWHLHVNQDAWRAGTRLIHHRTNRRFIFEPGHHCPGFSVS